MGSGLKEGEDGTVESFVLSGFLLPRDKAVGLINEAVSRVQDNTRKGRMFRSAYRGENRLLLPVLEKLVGSAVRPVMGRSTV